MWLANFQIDQPVDLASWRAFAIFSGYRLFLASALFFVFPLELPPDFLGGSNPELYQTISQFYLVTAVVLLTFSSKRWGSFDTQVKVQLTIDILVLTIIIHSSDGLQTGLGSLLVIVVVAGATLVPGRTALFIAALATLSILIHAGYTQITGDGITRYSHAGMLGATFFATALLAQTLAKKMQISQVLAEQRAQDVAKLALLNERIINRMQTGVLVVNTYGDVTQCNHSAKKLLGISNEQENSSLKKLAPPLAQQLWLWQHNNVNAFRPFEMSRDLPAVLARASTLDNGETLVYLDDATIVAQQVQQLKLASLGRLTASIAHEIRNPLGAISHAGELLAESHAQDEEMIKLTDIIQRHSARVNGIIETVLQMSKRKNIEPETLVLVPWFEKFLSEFYQLNQISPDSIELFSGVALIKIKTDEEQFHQIISNLVNNAWYYSDEGKPLPCVRIELTQLEGEVVIDVSDNGPGVSEKVQRNLFEPFYSQRQDGTGLGLYLARELCQANGARLNYISDYEARCCFRITYPVHLQESVQ